MPILPQMSPNDIYQHVRRWIDDYYEQNHETIEQWERAEESIHYLRSGLDATLRDIRRWGDTNRELWDKLRISNRVIAEVQDLSGQSPASWPESLKAISRSPGIPEVFSPLFQDFAKTIQRIGNLQRKYEHVQALKPRPQDADDFELVFNAFHALKSAEALFQDSPAGLDRCMEQMLERRQAIATAILFALLGWWSAASRQSPSFAEYRAAVESCAPGSEEASRKRLPPPSHARSRTAPIDGTG